MIHWSGRSKVFLTPLFSDGDYGFTPLVRADGAVPVCFLLYLATVFAAPRAPPVLALVACFALLLGIPGLLFHCSAA